MATPALPVMRPMPPAMKAAFCSCRQTTVSIFESTSALKTESILAPGTPNTCVTPCISSVRTTSSAPICGAFFEFSSIVDLLVSLFGVSEFARRCSC